MLSDEEKKAIEYLKQNSIPILRYDNFGNILSPLYYGTFEKETILNLIEKQSKEIEELKEKDDANLAYYDQIYQNGIYTGQKAVEDKIKAKIEEIDIEIQCCEYADDDTEEYKQDMEKEKRRLLRDKAVLQSLLEKE